MMKCIFFDRDGVINKRIIGSYVKHFSEFELNMKILPLLKFCDNHNFLKIIITNQQGIAKEYMTLEEVDLVHNQMNDLLFSNYGVKRFDSIFIASEFENSPPFRRKPSAKMIFEAKEKHHINLGLSFMIGDSETDIVAGNNANLKTIFYSDEELDIADFCSNEINVIIEFIKNN